MRCIASIVSCLALAGAAGCYRSSTPAEPAAPAVITAAPSVAWSDGRFEATRLPAVSADGAVVVIAIRDQDGARGSPNLRLELRARSGTAIAKHVVLTVEEADRRAPDAMGARIPAANRWLADQHAARRFVPLVALENASGGDLAGRGDVQVEFNAERFTLEHAGKLVVDRATPADWLATPRPPTSTGMVCENFPFIRAVAVAVEHRIAVLTIGYRGTDLCWEPDDTQHVVAW